MLDEAPSGWELATFGECFDFKGGNQPPKKTFVYEPTNGYVRLLQIRDFESDDKPAYIPEKASKVRCKTDDILIARYGASLGRILTGMEGAYNVALVKLILQKELNRRFVYYWLNSKAFQTPLFQVGSRSAQAGFNKVDLAPFPILLPPLTEQERIAEILSSVDDSIHAAEAAIEQAERVKRGLMEDLLTGGLGSEAIARGEVPDGWSTHEFGNIFKAQNDKSKQIQKSSYEKTGAYPIIDQGAEFIAGYSDGEPNTNFPVVIFGDHTRCVKWVDFPFFAGADGTQALYTSNHAVPKFGYYLMQHVELPNLGYSRHMRELKRKTFLVPNIEEQAKIVEILDSIQAQIDVNRTTMNQLQRLKRGLMDDLLTGRVRTVT